MQSHVDDCPLCDGPCREPFVLPPSTDPRPFAEVSPMPMPQESATAEVVDAPAEPVVEQKPPSGKRARRLQEDRMRRPSEDR